MMGRESVRKLFDRRKGSKKPGCCFWWEKLVNSLCSRRCLGIGKPCLKRQNCSVCDSAIQCRLLHITGIVCPYCPTDQRDHSINPQSLSLERVYVWSIMIYYVCRKWKFQRSNQLATFSHHLNSRVWDSFSFSLKTSPAEATRSSSRPPAGLSSAFLSWICWTVSRS